MYKITRVIVGLISTRYCVTFFRSIRARVCKCLWNESTTGRKEAARSNGMAVKSYRESNENDGDKTSTGKSTLLSHECRLVYIAELSRTRDVFLYDEKFAIGDDRNYINKSARSSNLTLSICTIVRRCVAIKR